MLTLSKIVLGPLLLAQGRWVRRTALRLPEAEGPREGVEAFGAGEPLRVLIVGDSSAAGVGVDHQDRAFARPLARLAAERIGRPVAWQLIAKSGVCAREAVQMLRAASVAPADLLVTAVGMYDVTGQRPARHFVDDVRELWAVASARAGVRLGVISGLPPVHVLPAAPQPLRWYLGRCASSLDARLRQWVDAAPHLRYCSLQWAAMPHEMAADGFHPGAKQYGQWAEAVAGMAAELWRGAR